MSIPTITPLPQAPQVTDAPSVFSQRANTFVAALGQLVTETNATTAEINQALAGALVLFDAYEGDWEAGSYGAGDVVRKDGEFYISLVDSNQQEPPGNQWQILGDTTPSGLIAMWSGSIATIPSGWALCDGDNGTPDLRDRFVVGAGSTYNPNDTGGSSDAVVVSHSHTVSGSTNTAGNHNHSITLQTRNVDGTGPVLREAQPTGFINQSYNTAAAGNHNHSVTGTAAAVGESGEGKNLPPYFALAYIMKL